MHQERGVQNFSFVRPVNCAKGSLHKECPCHQMPRAESCRVVPRRKAPCIFRRPNLRQPAATCGERWWKPRAPIEEASRAALVTVQNPAKRDPVHQALVVAKSRAALCPLPAREERPRAPRNVHQFTALCTGSGCDPGPVHHLISLSVRRVCEGSWCKTGPHFIIRALCTFYRAWWWTVHQGNGSGPVNWCTH